MARAASSQTERSRLNEEDPCIVCMVASTFHSQRPHHPGRLPDPRQTWLRWPRACCWSVARPNPAIPAPLPTRALTTPHSCHRSLRPAAPISRPRISRLATGTTRSMSIAIPPGPGWPIASTWRARRASTFRCKTPVWTPIFPSTPQAGHRRAAMCGLATPGFASIRSACRWISPIRPLPRPRARSLTVAVSR